MSAVSTELTVVDALDQSLDRVAFMTELVTHAKRLLVEAQGMDGIADVQEHRAQAQMIQAYTVQKNYGQEAEQAAAEIIRRCERRIAQLVRQGQEIGTIRSRTTGRPPVSTGAQQEVVSPHDLVPEYTLNGSGGGPGITALADDVSDAQFEEAIAEAKAEGNVSRANVVRKIKAEKGAPEPAKPVERHELLRRTRHLNSDRIINETVMAAAALDSSAIKHVIWDALDRDQLAPWVAQLDDAIRFLNRLRSNLKKEMTSEQDATGTEG